MYKMSISVYPIDKQMHLYNYATALLILSYTARREDISYICYVPPCSWYEYCVRKEALFVANNTEIGGLFAYFPEQ